MMLAWPFHAMLRSAGVAAASTRLKTRVVQAEAKLVRWATTVCELGLQQEGPRGRHATSHVGSPSGHTAPLQL